jgi:predicted secreted protein
MNRNVLPIQTRVRVRTSTQVVNAQGEGSGSIPVQLEEESRVTVGAIALAAGCPALVPVKIDDTPTLENWDVLLVLRDVNQQPVLAGLGLAPGAHSINWASFDEYGDPLAFLEGNLGLMFVAVDV